MERRRERNKGDEREREIDRQTELKGDNNERILFVCFFLKKNWPTPASFSFIFGLFKQTLQFFTTNICEKMSIQFTVPGFKPTTFGM